VGQLSAIDGCQESDSGPSSLIAKIFEVLEEQLEHRHSQRILLAGELKTAKENIRTSDRQAGTRGAGRDSLAQQSGAASLQFIDKALEATGTREGSKKEERHPLFVGLDRFQEWRDLTRNDLCFWLFLEQAIQPIQPKVGHLLEHGISLGRQPAIEHAHYHPLNIIGGCELQPI